MNTRDYRSAWSGPAWHEQVDYPYRITRHSSQYGTEIMAYGAEKHRAMRMAIALQGAEGGDVSIENLITGETMFYIKED